MQQVRYCDMLESPLEMCESRVPLEVSAEVAIEYENWGVSRVYFVKFNRYYAPKARCSRGYT